MIIFDAGLLARCEAQTLTPADVCKIALCGALSRQLPQAVVYASAQAQGVTAPAVFVRFGKLSARLRLGGVEQVTVEAQCRYLPLTAEDDGENESAMQAMLDALLDLCGGEADFCTRSRTAERTEAGAAVKGKIGFELKREDAAQVAEGMMERLKLAVQQGEV
ncbi:MAG TPA: hypothetical protein VN626_08905 [Clostridia bacterium]|nr:hypothetical protein [Clostridia bacterium]